jgi:hypothetical protein
VPFALFCGHYNFFGSELLDSRLRGNDNNRVISTFYECINTDELVKSLEIVMPDLIRHPERIEFTGFRLSPE